MATTDLLEYIIRATQCSYFCICCIPNLKHCIPTLISQSYRWQFHVPATELHVLLHYHGMGVFLNVGTFHPIVKAQVFPSIEYERGHAR